MRRGFRDLKARIAAAAMAAAVAAGVFAGVSVGAVQTALAAEETVESSSDAKMPVMDYTKKGSISITIYGEGDETVPGGVLALYKVADVAVDNGFKFVYADGFQELTDPLVEDSDLTAALAEKAAAVAEANGVTPVDTQTCDENGAVFFDDLELGLYVVVETEEAPGYVKISPFLVTVPFKNTKEGRWEYDVDAYPKPPIAVETTTTTTTTATTTPTIPQTGQHWLPVWILGGLGILAILFGMVRRGKGE